MKKIFAVLFILFSFSISQRKVFAVNECSNFATYPQPLKENNFLTIDNYANSGRTLYYFRFSLDIKDPDIDGIDVLNHTFLDKYSSEKEFQDVAIPNGYYIDTTTKKIYGNIGTSISTDPILSVGKHQINVLRRGTTYCPLEFNIQGKTETTLTPTPTTALEPSICEMRASPSYIDSSTDVSIQIVDDSDKLKDYTFKYGWVSKYRLRITVRNERGELVKETGLGLTPNDASISPDGTIYYYILKSINKFNPNQSVTVSMDKYNWTVPEYQPYTSCPQVHFIVGVGVVTPVPTKTPEEEAQERAKNKLAPVCNQLSCPKGKEVIFEDNEFKCCNKAFRDDIKWGCEPLLDNSEGRKCIACVTGKQVGDEKYDSPGSWTAIGCIPTGAGGFVAWILGPMIGIAGGIAFLLILGGGFSILFSQGNPETIAAGKERITAAVLGLLVIIFSVLILKVIGVDILDLPGFEQ